MTEEPLETESGSVLRRSLDDAVPVQIETIGGMRTLLKNTRTGEFFYSFCSMHWSWEEGCSGCSEGMWAHDHLNERFPLDK